MLTASLRANPILYADSQLIPYGSFSTQRPGGPTQYDLNISHPIDYSHKRQARTMYAELVLRVMEHQYQDAVRLGLDDLYLAYVDVLAARRTVRYARVTVEGLDEFLSAMEALYQGVDHDAVPTSIRPGPSRRSPRSGWRTPRRIFARRSGSWPSCSTSRRTRPTRSRCAGRIEDPAPPPPPEPS